MASADEPAQAPLRYVALGDSYSAGAGLLPLDPMASPSCLQSTVNYPHVLATRINASLTDATCSGADTTDYFEPQFSDVPPQLDKLTADTDLVTMTIGGNDSSVFSGAIQACITAAPADLAGSPCKNQYGDSFEDTVRGTTYPALVKALTAVQQRSPYAQVLILGYPSILPATTGCYPFVPVATGDVPYLRSLQGTLNDAVRRAASATGATYVDLNGPSEGRDACQPIGTRWVEPVIGGTNPVILHPNAQGEQALADLAFAAFSSLPSSSTLTGRVTGYSGRAVKGADVRVTAVGGTSTRSVTTRANGRFTLPGLPKGSYVVRVVDPKKAWASRYLGGGSSRSTARVVTVKRGKDVSGLDVRLKAAVRASVARRGGDGSVKVSVSIRRAVTKTRPGGKVTVSYGSRVKAVKVRKGRATLTLSRIPAGTRTVKVTYSGTDSTAGFTRTYRVRVR
ncbi:GDSL-type esterase/lipase family protein [Aeromicrobium fastidiosum]|uniref:GDSL-type esterase/lipase family protein n=1 Tax=Aeromicrobium fastidiosum TaxID=52699 RepID=UPI00202355E5|nr:GDSL-type esterase/lipase family protein [Aeromicrobium fastidiosum]MCL8250150.1 GDSL-type esterase/lipase family protein [Aeromicrobium fastidiosum]